MHIIQKVGTSPLSRAMTTVTMWVKLLQVSPLSISRVLTFNLQKRHHVMHTLCCNFTRIYTSFLFCQVGEAAPPSPQAVVRLS